MLFKGDSLNKQVGLTPHYYFIPTVYITRCVLACLVEVLTTRLSRIIPPPLYLKSMDEIIPLSTIVNHTGTVRGLDISDKFVVTCSWNNTVAVYSHSNIFPKLSQVNQASQDISIPGHLSYRLEGQGHNDGVYCVSLCDDTVVTGSRDRSVRVWLLGPTEYTLLRVLGHSGWVRDVTQDQDRVYSCDRNGEVLVWNKKMIKNSSDHSEEEILVRKLDDDRDTRGDVNCIKIMGSKMLTSLSIYDDCGYIAIKDFW